jgi:hypothetical protein
VVPKVLLRDNSTNAASSVSVSVTLIAEIWLGSVSDFSLGLSFVQKVNFGSNADASTLLNIGQ